MPITVTATQHGKVAVGMAMYIRTINGAKPSQAGGAVAGQESAVPSIAITPNATGSYIYGALLARAVTLTPQAGCTFAYNVSNNGLRYVLMRSSATTTAATALTMGANETANGTGITLFEVEADPLGGGLTEDAANSPAGAVTSAATFLTSSAFAPGGSSILVATVSTNGAPGTGSQVVTCTVADTGGTLIWTERCRQDTANNGYVGVWTAQPPVVATGTGFLSFFGD